MSGPTVVFVASNFLAFLEILWTAQYIWINLFFFSFKQLIIFFAAKDGEALYSQQKQDQELTVAQIMNSLLPNLDLNWRK